MALPDKGESSDVTYFIQILGGICLVGAIVNILFKKAYFISLGSITASILGLLLVQFSLSLKGPPTKLSFMGILKKIFHFHNLIIMVLLTSWVFDIYINNYTAIQSDKMPPEFYNISTSFTFVLLLQVCMVIGKMMTQRSGVEQLKSAHGDNTIFKKMQQLYNAQTSSFNALLNSINLILVLMLYVTSKYFVTDG